MIRNLLKRKKTAAVVLGGFAVTAALPSTGAAAHDMNNDGTWSDEHTMPYNASTGVGVSYGNVVAFWELMYVTAHSPSCLTGAWSNVRVNDVQARHGLTIDGVVGPNTWSSAKQHLGSATATSGGFTQYAFGELNHPGGPQGFGVNVAAGSNTWKRQSNTTWNDTGHTNSGTGLICYGD